MSRQTCQVARQMLRVFRVLPASFEIEGGRPLNLREAQNITVEVGRLPYITNNSRDMI